MFRLFELSQGAGRLGEQRGSGRCWPRREKGGKSETAECTAYSGQMQRQPKAERRHEVWPYGINSPAREHCHCHRGAEGNEQPLQGDGSWMEERQDNGRRQVVRDPVSCNEYLQAGRRAAAKHGEYPQGEGKTRIDWYWPTGSGGSGIEREVDAG